VLFILGLLIALADSPPWASGRVSRPVMKIVMGSTHLVLLFVAVTSATIVAIAVVAPLADGGWFAMWLTIAVLVLGGVFAATMLGMYFAFWSAVPGMRAHGNEAFAASRLTRHKNFLRLHFDEYGDLEIYAIGVRRMGRKWEVRPDEGDESDESLSRPRLAAKKEPSTPHLIETVSVQPKRRRRSLST
jgi:hypothetical protein